MFEVNKHITKLVIHFGIKMSHIKISNFIHKLKTTANFGFILPFFCLKNQLDIYLTIYQLGHVDDRILRAMVPGVQTIDARV